MNKVATERLENIANGVCGCLDETARQMARELLSLRTDAGDEEVERLVKTIQDGLGYTWDGMSRHRLEDADKAALKLKSLAIARGRTRTDAVNSAAEWANESERLEQQLRERDAENTSLEQRISRLSVEYEDLGKRFDEQASQIATLTAERDELKSGNDFLRQEIEDWKEANRRAEAERDEARKEVQLQRGAWEAQTNREKDACQRAGITFGGCDTVHDLADAVETLTAELAALKSCPEMGEVDLLAYWPDHEFKSQQYPKVLQLADLARRAIASHAQEKQRAEEEQHARVLAEKQRDEIIIDLNAVDRVDYLGELRHMAAYIGSEPSDAIFAARRILAICGKEVG